MIVAGADGCHSGWVVVRAHVREGRPRGIHADLLPSFEAVVQIEADHTVIDIPIGLLDVHVAGGRECDRAARKLLGRRRRSSVFTPPIRPLLAAAPFLDYAAARLIQPITKQTLGIVPKIAEVDAVMRHELQVRIHEGHPEVTFAALAGVPMRYGKKSQAGQAERGKVLRAYLSDLPALERQGCQVDDLFDACAMLLTAVRRASSRARSRASGPQTDSKGLVMDIYA